MEFIIKKILKVVGWKKLLRMAWRAVYDDLKRLAASTENTQLDDQGLMIVSEIIDAVLSDDELMVEQLEVAKCSCQL